MQMISPIYGSLLREAGSTLDCDSAGLKEVLKTMSSSDQCAWILDKCEAETLNLIYMRHCTLESACLFYPLVVLFSINLTLSRFLSLLHSFGLEASQKPS